MRWRCIVTWLAGAAVLMPCALWAFRPLPDRPIPDLTIPSPDEQSSPRMPVRPQFNREAFAADLWRQPPPEPEPENTRPPDRRPQPVHIQLLAIINEPGNDRTAALYDPSDDRIHVLRVGEQVGRHSIVSIGGSSVVLRDGTFEHTLELRTASSS